MKSAKSAANCIHVCVIMLFSAKVLHLLFGHTRTVFTFSNADN